MHEVVTLQFGQRANYLATHFWNAQESYFTYTNDNNPSIVDHDVHFRPGIGNDGIETYSPRTVIYDLKGGFGSLRKINALYEDVGPGDQDQVNVRPGVWEGSTVSQKQPVIQQIGYQRNLDMGLPTTQLQEKDVRYWSDFNRVFFHPRSLVQLNEYSLHSQLTPFANWSAGEELWVDVDREADLLDRDLRFFVEEADQLQGFQVFAGTDDAWGGWTNKYVDALRDEFPKNQIWIWAVEESSRVERHKMLSRAANSARSLEHLSKQVSAYLRIATIPSILPPYIALNGNSDWINTALIEAALESVTLPCRVRSGKRSSMSWMESTLNTNGRQNVYELGATFSMSKTMNEQHPFPTEATTFDINFTPRYNGGEVSGSFRRHQDNNPNHAFSQLDVCRGPEKCLLSSSQAESVDHEELLRRKFNEETVVEQFNIPLAFPQIDSYPDRLIQLTGDNKPADMLVQTGLTCTSAMKQTIWDLRDLVIKSSRVIEIEEREEMYNDLTETGEQYSFGWEDSDSNEDD